MAVVSEQKVRLSVGKTLVNSVVSNVKAAGDTGILKDIDTDLQAIKTDVEVTLPVTIENKANAAAAAVNAHTDSKSNTITSAISSDGADTRTKIGNEANLIKVGQSNINANISSSKQQILNKLDDLDIDLSPVETKVDAVKADTTYIKQKIDQGGGGGGSDPRVLASLGEDEEDVTVHEKLDKIGTPSEGQPSTLFEAIAEGGGGGSTHTTDEVYELVKALNDSHVVSGVSLEGWVFQDGHAPTSFGDALANIPMLTSVSDSNITFVSSNYFLFAATNLVSLDLPNLEEISAGCFVGNAPILENVNLPKLRKVYCTGMGLFPQNDGNKLKVLTLPALYEINSNTFRQMYMLEEIYLPNLEKINSSYNWGQLGNIQIIDIQNLNYLNNPNQWNSCDNLIDLRLGKKFVSSMNINTWSPTNALSSTLTTLIKNGEPFANNLEKLLYNIREHIAANLPDRTGLSALTITFSAAVKAAILADAATASAFTSKGWTIA